APRSGTSWSATAHSVTAMPAGAPWCSAGGRSAAWASVRAICSARRPGGFPRDAYQRYLAVGPRRDSLSICPPLIRRFSRVAKITEGDHDGKNRRHRVRLTGRRDGGSGRKRAIETRCLDVQVLPRRGGQQVQD